jgi:hypothetical protein
VEESEGNEGECRIPAFISVGAQPSYERAVGARRGCRGSNRRFIWGGPSVDTQPPFQAAVVLDGPTGRLAPPSAASCPLLLFEMAIGLGNHRLKWQREWYSFAKVSSEHLF